MRNPLFILFLAIFLVLAGNIEAKASADGDSQTYINLYQADEALAFGFKERLWDNGYATINLEYSNPSRDLGLAMGGVGFFPGEVLFFKLYAGGGLAFSRDHGYEYPYFIVGTHYIWFFSEAVYPWQEGREPFYRSGFSFRF